MLYFFWSYFQLFVSSPHFKATKNYCRKELPLVVLAAVFFGALKFRAFHVHLGYGMLISKKIMVQIQLVSLSKNQWLPARFGFEQQILPLHQIYRNLKTYRLVLLSNSRFSEKTRYHILISCIWQNRFRFFFRFVFSYLHQKVGQLISDRKSVV